MAKEQEYIQSCKKCSECSEALRTAEQVQRLAVVLKRSRLAEYVELMNCPWNLMWRSFVAGMCRGAGFALGFVLLSALALYLLNLLADLGIPILGDFIAELLVYVESVQVTR